MATKVYIAGPYSSDPEENTYHAISCMNNLLDAGMAPFCPHLSHYADARKYRPYAEWMTYCMEWVKACDVVLRVQGESEGADSEVRFAIEQGIPVVFEDELDRVDVIALLNAAVNFTPEPAPAKPASVLDEANSIVSGSRHQAYGHPGDNHGTTAEMFRAYLKRRYGVDLALDGRAVCMLNILQKVSRDAHWPQRDNPVDIAGYADNAQRCTDHVPTETPHFTG